MSGGTTSRSCPASGQSTPPPTLSLGSDLADLAERLEPLEHAFRVVAERLNHLSDLAPQFLHWDLGGKATKTVPCKEQVLDPQAMFEDAILFPGWWDMLVPVRVDF